MAIKDDLLVEQKLNSVEVIQIISDMADGSPAYTVWDTIFCSLNKKHVKVITIFNHGTTMFIDHKCHVCFYNDNNIYYDIEVEFIKTEMTVPGNMKLSGIKHLLSPSPENKHQLTKIFLKLEDNTKTSLPAELWDCL